MFGIGPTELIVLLVVGLIVLGPERLPQVAAQVGKAIRDFRRMSDDMTGEFQRTLQLGELTGADNNEATAALTAEPSTAATPNGASDSFTFNLAPQVIPADVPDTSPPESPAEEQVDAAPPAEDVLIAINTVATKADPHAGASLLDEPLVHEAPAAQVAAAEPETATLNGDSDPIQPMPLPEQPPADLNADSVVTTAASSVPVVNGFADAWDAVINTEATRSLPTPEEAAVMTAATATEDPARPKI